MPKIKCLLVDDHTLFRQGVRRLLESESDFEVIAEAADGGEAVEKARDTRPDVVLIDIGMQGLSSFEAARQIKKNRPETKMLFLTMYDDEDYLVQCLEVGASGYVLKDTPAPQLLTAVRDVYKGGKFLSSQVLGKLVEDFRSRVRDTRMRPRMSTLKATAGGVPTLRRRLSRIFHCERPLSGLFTRCNSGPGVCDNNQVPICQSPRIQRWRRITATRLELSAL